MLPSRWSLNIHGEGKAATAAPGGRSGSRGTASAAGECPGPQQRGTPAPLVHLRGPSRHRLVPGLHGGPQQQPGVVCWIQRPWQAAISGWSRDTPGAARRDAAAAVRRRRRAGGTLLVAILDTFSGGGRGCPQASGSPPAPKPGGFLTHQALCPPVSLSWMSGAAWDPWGAGAGLVGPPRDPAARGVLHPFPCCTLRQPLPPWVGKNGPDGLCHLNFMAL